jgi:KDO2-lipid IV(A) lauroyltransferase
VNLTAVAWRVVPKLPQPLARGLFTVAADVAWLLHGDSVRQLEKNLTRVTGDDDQRHIRKLSRKGMRSYLRYFCEAFQLGVMSDQEVDSLVTLKDHDRILAMLGKEPQVVLALGHMGNWDLAGAFASRALGPVTTVAEHLEPEEVFQDFLAMREKVGLTIIPVSKNEPVFRKVLKAAKKDKPWIIPLLADRDLGRGGVEVDWFGHKALMAAGPAALAIATGRPLHPVSMYREGRGYVLVFHDEVPAPDLGEHHERIQELTQAWADVLARAIAEHPTDWHMLQKVFVEDLDPERLERTRGAQG